MITKEVNGRVNDGKVTEETSKHAERRELNRYGVGESTNHVSELTSDVGELCHASEMRLSNRTNDRETNPRIPSWKHKIDRFL